MRKKYLKRMATVTCAFSLVATSFMMTGCGSQTESDSSSKTSTSEDKKEDKDDEKKSENDEVVEKEDQEEVKEESKADELKAAGNIFTSSEQTSSINTSDGKEIVYINIAKPQIINESDKELSKKINDEIDFIMKRYDESIKECENVASEYISADDTPESVWSYEVYTSSSRNDDAVLSISMNEYSYLGGPHPNSDISCYNFDAKTGETLGLIDVAEDKYKLQDCIFNYIKKEASQKYLNGALNEESQEFETAVRENVMSDGSWCFTDTGMLFVANTYALGPYAMGSFSFEIPYSEIEGLKAEYSKDVAYQLNKNMGMTIECDLNNDGNVDTIEYSDNAFYINEKNFFDDIKKNMVSEDGWTAGTFAVMDVCENDDAVELVIIDPGMSDDYQSVFFRYDGEKLNMIGSVPGNITGDGGYGDGNGTIYSNNYAMVGPTQSVRYMSKLVDGKIETSEGFNRYLTDVEYVPSHSILQDVEVYAEPDTSSEKIKLTKDDGKIGLVATDNKEWLAIRTQKGDIRFVHMNSSCDTENDVYLGDIFEEVLFAG